MIKIEVQDACAVCVQPQLLTTGMAGAVVEFSFDEVWDGLTKCAVFTDGMEVKDALLQGNTCVIPHEVLTTCGRVLSVGVYGTNSTGDVVIPTIYANVSVICAGADPSGDESYLLTPDVTAQIQTRLDVLETEGSPGTGGTSAVGLDTTLTVPGKAADAKAVGDALVELEAQIPKGGVGGVSDYTELTNKPKINGVEVSGDKTSADYGIGNPTDEQVATSVEAWLDAHPEATTTVADGSINPDKTTWMHQVWHNIFDKDDAGVEDGRFFYTDANGNVTGDGTANYFVSGFIPVVAGRQYYFNAANIHYVKIFDKDKAYIASLPETAMGSGTTVDIPDGAAYMRFDVEKTTLTIDAAQVYEYIGEVWEYDTYKNLCSIVISDAGYSKAVADLVEKKFVDGSLAPAELFADESILYKQVKGWDEFHWNIVNPAETEAGSLNTSGAEIVGSTAFTHQRTGFIPVSAGEELHFLWQDVYYYNSEKQFVGAAKQENGVAVVEEGVSYIRATTYSTDGSVPKFYIYRRGYGKNALRYDSGYGYEHGFPVFKDEDSKEGFKVHLGIHPWADKKFSIIGDSFTAPGTWCNVMCDNLKAVYHGNHAVSGATFTDADGVPKTAYEQAQEMAANGESPDAILITMGTNDANNSVTMGEIVESNSISDFDLTTYTGGMQACLNYLQNNFPNATIYVGWTPAGANCNFSAADTTAPYVKRMQEVCLMYGVEYIETRTCGITKYSDIYADCWENGVNGGHPSGVGQQKIGAYMTRLMRSKR